MMSGSWRATSLQFAATVRTLGAAARERGLVVPGFRSPPRRAGAERTLRWAPDGTATVAVVVRNRPYQAVVADMIEGLVIVNELDGHRCHPAPHRPVGGGRRLRTPRPPGPARRSVRAPSARVAQLADAEGLNPSGPSGPCGFDPRPGHRVPSLVSRRVPLTHVRETDRPHHRCPDTGLNG